MAYTRGNHPNSRRNLEIGGFKKGEVANPKGRPKGSTVELLGPLIRVIDDQQSRMERQASRISEYAKKLNEAEAELKEAFTLIEKLNDVTDYENEKEEMKKQIENLKAMCETLQEELNLKTQRIDKLLEELKPYREAKMLEIKGKIGLEYAGRSRR